MNTAYNEIAEAQQEIRDAGRIVGISAAAIQAKERHTSRPLSLTAGDTQPYHAGADPYGSPLSRFSTEMNEASRAIIIARISRDNGDLASAAAYLGAAINSCKAARAALAETGTD